MNIDVYIGEYIMAIFSLIVSLYCIKIIFSKKLIIDPKKAYPSKREFVKKYVKEFNIIARIFLLMCVIVFFTMIIPAFQDLGNIINKKFEVINCKILDNANYETIIKYRTFKIINVDTGEIIYMKVKYGPINEGEYYTIEYLPHMKIGKIIRKI